VSTDQWQLSLSQLYGTADALEATVRAVPTVPVPISAAPPAREPALPHSEHRSLAQVAAWTVAHTAVTVSLLIGVSLVVDPLLPQGERPRLSAAAENSGEGSAIPPYRTYRP
jgi:hypothetical protein